MLLLSLLRTGQSMVMAKLDAWVTMGVINRALIATLLGLFLVTVPSLGGETKERKRHLKRGLKIENQGEFERAIEEYGRAIELDRELEKAWFRRGVLYFRLGQFEEARSDLTRAIELKPDHGIALYARGVANRHLKDLEQAESDLTEAGEILPVSLLIYVERAHAYTLRKQFPKAISDLDLAEELYWNTASRIREARIKVRVGKQIDNKLWLSKGTFGHSRYGFPYSSNDSLFLSSTFRDQVESSTKGARQELRGHFFDVYFRRGMTKWLMNEKKGAYEEFGTLLRTDYDTKEKGILYYLMGNIALARESLLASLTGSTRERRDYVQIWLWLASVYLGQLEEANARIHSHFFGKSSKSKFRYSQQIARFLL